MAYSIIETVGNGTSQYAINFTLGFNSRTEVTCQVNNEVDGLNDPVHRTLSWINDGLVEVAGGPFDSGDTLVFRRTIDKTELIHDYENGEPIEERNLDESNKQNLMSIHELLDGRFESPLAQDLDMGGHKIINLAPGTELTDAVNLEQLTNFIGGGGGSVNSVTGLNTDNTDPTNPIVRVSVNGTSVTGAGTPGSPLASPYATSALQGAQTLAQGFMPHVVSPVVGILSEDLSGDLTYELPEVVALIDGLRVVIPATSGTMDANIQRDLYAQADGTYLVVDEPIGSYPDIERHPELLKVWSMESTGTYVARINLMAATYRTERRSADYYGSIDRLVELYYIKPDTVPWASTTLFNVYGQLVETTDGRVYQVVLPGTSGATKPTGVQVDGEHPLMDGSVGLFFYCLKPYLGMFRYGVNNGIEYYFCNLGVADVMHRVTVAGSPLGIPAGSKLSDLALNHMNGVMYHVCADREDSGAYGFGQKIISSGFIWRCQTVAGGTTAASTPFTTGYSLGSTVVDNDITWKAVYPHYDTANLFWLNVDQTFESYRFPDSHDSYASTFASIVAQYGRIVGATAMTDWLDEASPLPGYATNKDLFDAVMDINLLDQLTGNNLTYTFQNAINPSNGSSYNIQFYEDNCESSKGARDLAYIYGEYGDTTNETVYSDLHDDLEMGLAGMYSTTNQVFARYFGDDTDTWPEFPGWYPYCQAQFFGEKNNLPHATSSIRYDVRQSVFRMYPNWWVEKSRSSFPDNFIGVLMAGEWQDTERALIWQKNMDRFYIDNNSMTIGEFSSYLLMKDILVTPFSLLGVTATGITIRKPGGEIVTIPF